MALTSTIRRRNLSDTVTTEVEQKYVVLSNGDNELIPASEGYQIQIIAMAISTNIGGTFLLLTGVNTIFPFMLSAGQGPIERAPSWDRPLFVGNEGENLNMNVNSSPTTAGIYLQYRYK